MERSNARLVDASAIGLGVLTALAFAVPAVIAAQIVDAVSDTGPGAWLFVVLAVFVVGFGTGGHVAARRYPRVPLLNGVAAGVAAYVVVQALAVVRLTINDDAVTWAAVPLFLLIAAAAGLVGALAADTGSRR